MNTFLLTILLTAAAPQFDVQTLDGQILRGALVELSSERVTLDAADGRVSLDTERLLSIVARKKPAPGKARVVVELTDGSTILGRQYAARGTLAKITLSDGDVLETPTNIVRTIRFQPESGPAATEWKRLIDRKADADLLVVRKDEGLDYHKGVLHDVTEDVVRFDFDGEALPVERSKIFGLAYCHPTEPDLPPAVCRITDSSGSRWSVRSLGMSAKHPSPTGRRPEGEDKRLPSPTGRGAGGEGADSLADHTHLNPLPAGDGTLQWTTPAGLSVVQAPERIVQIDFSAGKIAYLSDLKPERVRWTPYFSMGNPPASVEQFYAPRYDRNFDGGPLQLGGTPYAKGLALHSRTELVYRLPDGFGRFRAVAGIDDAVRPGGKARLLVRGDGRQLLDAVLLGSDPPRAVDLNLSGVRRLTIVVDFGDSPSSGDYLLLCNARLSK